MRVLLAATPMSRESHDVSAVTIAEPLAIEYIGAGVRENHDVKVIDLRLDTEQGLKETLESFKPDIIGCGAITAQVYPALEICAAAKELMPGILTVVGGHHATLMPSDFFDENVDVIVMGEGVSPFKKICDYHEKGKNFDDIENIYCRDRKNGKMVFTRKEPFPALDSLPFPARELTSHIRHNYTSMLLYTPRQTALIRGSTGCYYRCNFCPVSAMLDHKLHTRDIDKIIEEFESIKEPFIIWVDDEFLLDTQRAVLLAKEIEKTGIKKYHFCMGRSDTIVKHPKCIEAWAKAGMHTVFIGIESHREVDLKRMKKGTTLSNNREAIRILHENNIQVRGNIMIQPDFDKEDFKKVADYIRELGVEITTFSVYTPVPGTALWEETRDQFISDNYNLFDMMHTVLPTKLSLKGFYKEYTDLIFKKAVTKEEKKKFMKAMKPAERWKLFKKTLKIYKNLRNAYRLYN